jgi:hypothetical protein
MAWTFVTPSGAPDAICRQPRSLMYAQALCDAVSAYVYWIVVLLTHWRRAAGISWRRFGRLPIRWVAGRP